MRPLRSSRSLTISAQAVRRSTPRSSASVKENAGKVRLVTRDFPLTQHAEAFKAAEAAEAAREQGKYWEYVHALMQNQSSLGVEKLKSLQANSVRSSPFRQRSGFRKVCRDGPT